MNEYITELTLPDEDREGSYLVKRRRILPNRSVYPFRIFSGKLLSTILFAPVTIFYGSNGESALDFFIRSIEENALYLLDEPENSLSVSRQIELKNFLFDSARYFGCQFVLATHSPIFLSLEGARIYDLDSYPVRCRKWTELENVRSYYAFFRSFDKEFAEPPEEDGSLYARLREELTLHGLRSLDADGFCGVCEEYGLTEKLLDTLFRRTEPLTEEETYGIIRRCRNGDE